MFGSSAVTGIGESKYYRAGRSPYSVGQLASIAIRGAIADAGLRPRDIDGIVTFHDHQHDAPKKQNRTPLGRNDVVEYDADDQGQADTHGKSNSQAGNVDGGHQQKVGDVEHSSAEQGVDNMRRVCIVEVICERERASSDTAQA